ncbi:MAG: ATPase, T2SS/T4P/T4SS family, partial [Candidatus Veblenbacteria bacterium]|nr:ATPase, T2SS/T4P/T4SS family [Candidatus Veblenbacteria bacterium]
VVLRIFNRDNLVMELANLGFEQAQLELVQRMLMSPYGINLITGQIASGKTTLLYSMLNALNTSERNIMTLEDPVEFRMANIRQMQVAESVDFTFARGMRAAVRQDPDVIMLGEIRDNETAQSAFQAALTGTLVFSTFHTFDVSGLVIRLIEMGIPRSVVAHALTGVVSTRLVRKVCEQCRAEVPAGELEQHFLGAAVAGIQFMAGQGCEECRQTGYRGRVGIYEVVMLDDDIRVAIIEERDAGTLKSLVQDKLSLPLHEAALNKVRAGVTTVAELVRVIGSRW